MLGSPAGAILSFLCMFLYMSRKNMHFICKAKVFMESKALFFFVIPGVIRQL